VPVGGADAGTVGSGPNVVAVTVDPGPENIGYTDGLFVTVKLCVPGTTTCNTIDHVLVDTGSVGVRVLETAIGLTLPAATNASGVALAECTPFVGGTSWGALKLADVQVGGESASALAVQIIGATTYAMPSSCTGTPVMDLKTLAANGIFGVGSHLQDCGQACAQPVLSGLNPGLYYACPNPSACASAATPVAEQVSHPVSRFSVDNNGVIIRLPSLPEGGLFSTSGQLVFGIGTQTNNALGNATVFPLDGLGFISTTFPVGGTTYEAYLDSGTNGLFFLDEATANLNLCAGNDKAFYCPATTANLTATISADNGSSASVDFRVANVDNLDPCLFAFDDLAGPMPGFPTDPGFDWGLPFFFGRDVYVAIEHKDTPAGTGSFFAF